jgi:hypothetical protein
MKEAFMLLVRKLIFQVSDRTYTQNNQDIKLDECIKISDNLLKYSKHCKKQKHNKLFRYLEIFGIINNFCNF